MLIYEEGDLVKYRVWYSITFAPYLNYVIIYYLYVLHKKMDKFDLWLSDSNFCNFPGSVLPGLLLHIMFWYASVSSGGKHINTLLIFHNTFVHYCVSWLFEIIK